MQTKRIYIGESVVCDYCNADIPDDSVQGGCFAGSYAVCPRCAEGVFKNAEKDDWKNIELINGSFRKAVLKRRNGRNYIEVTSF